MTASPLISAIVPVFNKRAFVDACARALLAAADGRDDVEILFVDHGSTDGSRELLEGYAARQPERVRVVRQQGGTVCAVRNTGARAARGRLFSFVDSDVVVRPDFFATLLAVWSAEGAGAAAVGCEYDVPADHHWSEPVWHALNVVLADGDRTYLNGGDLAITREAFEAVGGFDERLSAGEDSDICERIVARGGRVFESRRLAAVHLGNPKSLAAFYRKQVWHGEGIVADRSIQRRTKMAMMLLAHIGLTIVALAALVLPTGLPLLARLALAVACLLLVPAATVAYRVRETRRWANPVAAVVLYFVFYAARADALVRALRRHRREAAAPVTAAARG
jgi:glycosyltransferase involved in cell wall biosynthesis